MKRLVWLLAIVALLFPVRALSSECPEEIGAKAYCLLDRESGRVLFAYNEDERLPMASTTKIMTALLAVEQCEMEEIVLAGANASGVPGTSIYLSEGETLRMRDMLLGLMLRSGNDAAVAIAEHIGGDVAAFAEMMNARAAELAVNARFVTPNGLDAPGHGASAKGMCKLAAAALEHEEFREIVGTKHAVIPWSASVYDRSLTNKNRLLTDYPGATGVKTGYTSAAGRCLVFSAERDGMELVGAVLNCYTWFDSAAALLDEGFAVYSMATALQEGEIAGEIRVTGGSRTTVEAIAKQDLRAPVREHEAWRLEVELSDSVDAPVEAGTSVGTARMIAADGGETLAQCDLVAADTVVQGGPFSALRRAFENWLRALPSRGSTDNR